jgi:hypothetical protein
LFIIIIIIIFFLLLLLCVCVCARVFGGLVGWSIKGGTYVGWLGKKRMVGWSVDEKKGAYMAVSQYTSVRDDLTPANSHT